MSTTARCFAPAASELCVAVRSSLHASRREAISCTDITTTSCSTHVANSDSVAKLIPSPRPASG